MQKGAGLALLLPLGSPVLKPNLQSEEERRSVRVIFSVAKEEYRSGRFPQPQ